MEQHLLARRTAFRLPLHPYNNLSLFRHPPLLEHQPTCRIGSLPRRHHKSIKSTPTIARQSRTQDSLWQMALLALLSPEQLPSVHREEPRHLRAKQAMRAKSQPDQKVHQDSRQARRKLHWREYGANCSTKRVILRSGLANSYVALLCT